MSRSLLVAFIALAVLPASAMAGTNRYASPTGSGTTCSLADPCTLTEAYDNNPSYTNDVVVLPGTYGSPISPIADLGSSGTAAGTDGRNIYGQPGAPRPTIYVTSSPAVYTAVVTRFGVARDLKIVVIKGPNTSFGIDATDGSMERVSVSGDAPVACSATQNTTNALCTTSADSGVAMSAFWGGGSTGPVYTFGYTLRNVTAIASGATSDGIEAIANSGIVLNITAINTIAHGTNVDAHATTNGVNGAEVHVVFDHSNYLVASAFDPTSSITPAGSGTNQTVGPTYEDLVNYKPAFGSPTIDAGADDPLNGTADVEGNPRQSGTHTDIGAYEYFAPAAPGPPAAPVLSGVKLANSKFRAAKSGDPVSIASAPRGTTLRFNVSAAGGLFFKLEQYSSGRKVKGKCKKKTSANKKAKKCTLLTRLSHNYKLTTKAGANTVKLGGRWGRGALKPSKYKLTMTPNVGASIGTPQSVSFRIVE
ncbi:MAG: choice-of-anchor Q domain-containing protein [Solirubrobacterales bacterium]